MDTPPLEQPIADGRTAEVYAWGEGRVLKLYREWCPRRWVDSEAKVARIVHAAGARSPAVVEVVDVESRRGIVYERVDGVPMVDALWRRPWRVRRYARLFARLHADMHTRSVPDLTPLRARLEQRVARSEHLPPALRDAVLARLAALPDGDRLCHGDFHPDNVMLTAAGPVIIDWVDATRGHPMADVARTVLLATVGEPPSRSPLKRLRQAIADTALGTYLYEYSRITASDPAGYEAWLPVVAAARLDEEIPNERDQLVEIIRAPFGVL